MLHHQTRKAIIAKYPLVPERTKEEIEKEIFDQLVADGKDFEDSEITSIIEEIFNQNSGVNSGDNAVNAPNLIPPAPEEKKSVNKNYEEWRVEAKRQDINDAAGTKIGSKIVSWEKLKLVRTTSISPEKAELLNSQSGNTNLRLFEVE